MRDKLNTKSLEEIKKATAKKDEDESPSKENPDDDEENENDNQPDVEQSPMKPEKKKRAITDEKLLRIVETGEASIVYLQHNLEEMIRLTDEIFDMQRKERPVKRLTIS